MKIDGKYLSELIIAHTKACITDLQTTHAVTPKLVDFCVTPNDLDMQFINMKSKIAERAGVIFEAKIYEKIPKYLELVKDLTVEAKHKSTSGLIIQLPLPTLLSAQSLAKSIPVTKDIEGKNPKSPYNPPIALAMMTILKQIYLPSSGPNMTEILFQAPQDVPILKKIIRNKKLILVGRGMTGGGPIGNFLTKNGMSYLGINSKTPNPEVYLKDADIIITAVGQKVIFPSQIKKGVILLSAGLRRDETKWVGDYDESEVEDIASHYTPTPGGIGPLDVAYVCYNTYLAALSQLN